MNQIHKEIFLDSSEDEKLEDQPQNEIRENLSDEESKEPEFSKVINYEEVKSCESDQESLSPNVNLLDHLDEEVHNHEVNH